MTQAVVKSEETGNYYMLTLHYVEIGDKYLLTLKDMTARNFICKRQNVPHQFAIYSVPVDELDDPSDVLRILKERLQK